MRRKIVIAAAVVGLALAVGAVTPAGAQVLTRYVGSLFQSTAPSGSNGFACKVNGCRVDLGTGASDYIYSDGANIVTPTGFVVGGPLYTTNGSLIRNSSGSMAILGQDTNTATAVAVKIGNLSSLSVAGANIANFYSDNGTTLRSSITKDGWFITGSVVVSGQYITTPQVAVAPQTLGTCGTYSEGAIVTVAGSGATRTKVCACTFTPTGSVWAWSNIAANNSSSGVGTSTTCP